MARRAPALPAGAVRPAARTPGAAAPGAARVLMAGPTRIYVHPGRAVAAPGRRRRLTPPADREPSSPGRRSWQAMHSSSVKGKAAGQQVFGGEPPGIDDRRSAVPCHKPGCMTPARRRARAGKLPGFLTAGTRLAGLYQEVSQGLCRLGGRPGAGIPPNSQPDWVHRSAGTR